MKRTVIGVVVAAVAVCGAFVQAKESGAQDAALAAQKKFVEAYRTCNVPEMNKIVTEDMQFIHVGGMTQDRTTFVNGVGQCSLADLNVEVTKVRMYGDAAVIMGKFNYKTKQGPAGMLIISEVFVKQNGAWRFASHQSTAPASR